MLQLLIFIGLEYIMHSHACCREYYWIRLDSINQTLLQSSVCVYKVSCYLSFFDIIFLFTVCICCVIDVYLFTAPINFPYYRTLVQISEQCREFFFVLSKVNFKTNFSVTEDYCLMKINYLGDSFLRAKCVFGSSSIFRVK